MDSRHEEKSRTRLQVFGMKNREREPRSIHRNGLSQADAGALKVLVAGDKVLVAGDKVLVAGDKVLVAGDEECSQESLARRAGVRFQPGPGLSTLRRAQGASCSGCFIHGFCLVQLVVECLETHAKFFGGLRFTAIVAFYSSVDGL